MNNPTNSIIHDRWSVPVTIKPFPLCDYTKSSTAFWLNLCYYIWYWENVEDLLLIVVSWFDRDGRATRGCNATPSKRRQRFLRIPLRVASACSDIRSLFATSLASRNQAKLIDTRLASKLNCPRRVILLQMALEKYRQICRNASNSGSYST